MSRHILLALALSFGLATANAKDAQPCGPLLEVGQPVLRQPTSNTQLLCYGAYAVLYSNQTRTALWSAERLTGAAADAARTLPRDSEFYEEERLAPAERARLQDFARSGYDRGHLAPSGDFADKTSQAESFSLANVVPQNSVSNRRTWSHIETSTRKLARKYGAIQVVTGPVFAREPATLNGRIRIPAFLWKTVYVPGVGAAAYVARNDATPAYSAISIEELAHFTGIDPFPTLTRAQRTTVFDLPAPTPHPGEKAARRVAFSWLVSGAMLDDTADAPLHHRVADNAAALAALVLAYAK